MLVNRLMTRRGELAPLGHPDYGSRHHELIGEPNTERNRNLVKLYILQALRGEPRVAKVERCVVFSEARPREIVRVEITIRLIDEPNPLNLVIPVELGAPS
jgi:phage baseplate assembly protein W